MNDKLYGDFSKWNGTKIENSGSVDRFQWDWKKNWAENIFQLLQKSFGAFHQKNTNDLHNFMIYLFKIHLNSWSRMCQNWFRRCDDWDNSKLTELKANRNIRPFIAEWSSSAPKERKHCVCDSTNEYDTNHVGFFSKTGFEAKYTADYQHVS